MVQGLGADALAVVRHLQDQAALILLGRKVDLATRFPIFYRIGDQVVQHPFQLSPVGGDGIAAFGQRGLEGHAALLHVVLIFLRQVL